jgi:hypothetical protein
MCRKRASKANWFESALGFNRGNASALAEQIVFDEAAAVRTATIQQGLRFDQVISITGANGRVGGKLTEAPVSPRRTFRPQAACTMLSQASSTRRATAIRISSSAVRARNLSIICLRWNSTVFGLRPLS